MALICKLSQQWSFVGSKARQHWLWYVYNTKTGGVLAYTFGPGLTKPVVNCGRCLPFTIGMLTTDEWGSYARELPKEKHLTGKIFTQHIERNNLTLRTRIKRLARRTICFSRSVELHEKVIGAFIENICSTNWSHHPSDKLSLDDYQTEYTAKDFYLILLFFSNDIYYILHHIHRHMTFPRPHYVIVG